MYKSKRFFEKEIVGIHGERFATEDSTFVIAGVLCLTIFPMLEITLNHI